MSISISKLEKSNTSGLILCGGAARRLNGQDKGLLTSQLTKNRPLIEHQLDLLKPQVSNLAISANRNLLEYQSYGYPVYTDKTRTQYDGPLQGILSGLYECKTDWLYVQPIDTPNLPNHTIETFLKRVVGNSAKVFYLVSNERNHYLNLLIHRTCYDTLNEFVERGERRVKTYLDLVKAQAINLGWEEIVFKNLNDLSDYKKVD